MPNKSETRICIFYDRDDPEAGCQGEFTVGRGDSMICPRCRANDYYWKRREKEKPGALRHYRHVLGVRTRRTNEWAGVYSSNKKVIHITTARKRRHG